MDDSQIINLYFARDENAIIETKNKYQNMCYRIAQNILYNREDSEECVNDTWLFTWNNIPPRRPSVFSSFVSKITRNTAIDRYRKRNAQKRVDSHMEDIAGEAVSYTHLDVYKRQVMKGSSDSAVVEYLNQNGMTYSQLVASNVMVLVAGVIYLAAGVVGVKQAGKVENAGLCVGMGGLLIAEVVAEVIVTLNFGDFDPASVIRMLMFPAIYMIGAVLNWQAKKTRR